MKFRVKVDCTPEEAREFLGLPDVQAFQNEVMELVRERTQEHLKAMDPEAMMKTWMPMGLEAMSTLQQTFMNSFAGAPGKTDKND